MLTIFAIPKAFNGHNEIIQRNAIKSWTLIRPRPEILLMGNDPGTEEVAREFGLRHCPNIDRNDFGTPLVNSIFDTAAKEASTPMLCYTNSDIIFPTSVSEKVALVTFKKFMLIGQRWNMDITAPLDFSDPEWEEKLHHRATTEAKLHPPTGVDYFVFPRDCKLNIPPFAIGRTVWDNWLVFRARLLAMPVIDATQSLTVIHQNHGYGVPGGADAIWTGPEAQANLQLAGGYTSLFNMNDSNFVLTSTGTKRRQLTRSRLHQELYLHMRRYPKSAFVVRLIQKILKPSELWRSVAIRLRKGNTVL